jgi:hypothetical protein
MMTGKTGFARLRVILLDGNRAIYYPLYNSPPVCQAGTRFPSQIHNRYLSLHSPFPSQNIKTLLV